jgi:hypothetical protein
LGRKRTHDGNSRGWARRSAGPWNTIVLFGGRYRFGMQVDIEIDWTGRTFTPVGEPWFYLKEYGDVERRMAVGVADDKLTMEQE